MRFKINIQTCYKYKLSLGEEPWEKPDEAVRQWAAAVTALGVWTTATCIDDWWSPSELQPNESAAFIIQLNSSKPCSGGTVCERWWPAAAASPPFLPPRCRYVFGAAKSQAVSWAHFHMARTSRVKPMSLGFSSPRISRCFMMAMNSLLLSSPLPGAQRDRRRRWRSDETTHTDGERDVIRTRLSKSRQDQQMDPVDGVVPSNSLTDNLQYWQSFTASNLCSRQLFIY